jgi:hypothetical protein
MNWLAFTNPWLLTGLAAVGLPLFIHWLTRARPQRIAFPPFKFLVEAGAGQQAVNRLRTILLLAIRCLLALALALLFARPFLKPAGAAAAAPAVQRVVLVLDASLSMRAGPSGVTLFARAQAGAAEVLRALPAGSEAAVILEGATPRLLLPALSENLPALHDLVIKSQPTFECGDPAAALALAQKTLHGAGTIHIFSDFQKANWETVRELPAGVACRLHPATAEAVANEAITDARLVPATPVIGEPVEIQATVFNCSARPREETVRLEMGDETRETQVTLPAFGTAAAAFAVAFPRAGAVAGKVSLAPDDLPEDNTRYLAANVGKALEVVVVSDADDADWNSAAFYLCRALAPSPQVAPGIHLVRRRTQDLDRGVLETADVFCLAAPATLSGEAVEIIARRVNEGARLISFLDGPTAPGLMFPMLNPPFELEAGVTSSRGDSVTMGARRVFGELEAGDFSALRFRRHWQNHPDSNRGSEVVLAYGDGSAALTISPAGRGSMVLANLPLTPDGGDFIGHPLFPSLMHELLRALRRDSTASTITPGNPWTLEAPTTGEGAFIVTDAEGKEVKAEVLVSGRSTRLALPPVKMPGIYAVKQAGAVVAYAAVNVDPRESDTRPLALENLQPGTNALVTVQSGEEENAAGEKTRDLWPQVAASAAILLGAEALLLALWRGSRTAAAKPKEAAT